MVPAAKRLALVLSPAALWVLLVAIALATRPLLPVDETRYVGVAWEMWLRGDFLVPYLNGEPYSHKPPLLFWLMAAGWSVLGINDWWPRLVAPLFALASLGLVRAVARDLWPGMVAVRDAAPLVLMASGFWALFSTLTMFDTALAFFALLGLLGVIRAWRHGGAAGWWLFGVAIGLGVLAKGPVILLDVLPAALLAPVWGPRLEAAAQAAPKGGWRAWYWAIAGSLVVGAAIGLAWALPAALRGGEAYRNAIFWGQTAGRMVESFAHERPFWWYAALTPPLWLPLVFWPRMWRAFGAWRSDDGGLRFCVAWAAPVFVAFSFISGKQLHYLVPLFPAAALAAARLLVERAPAEGSPGRELLVPGMVVAAASLALFVIAGLPLKLPDWAEDVVAAWVLLPGVVGIALAAAGLRALAPALLGLAVLASAVVVGVHLMARPALAYAFDLRPLAERLGLWEREGRPLAHYGKYHGQFQFLGRLYRPMAIIGDQEVRAWARANPEGLVVTYHLRLPEGGEPVYAQAFRRYTIGVWDAPTALANPDLVRRPD